MMLERAAARRTATGAFTCYTLSAADACLRAAQATREGLVILLSPAAYVAPGGTHLLTTLRALADTSEVPILIQLDHVRELDPIRQALDQGIDAVMADGSRLPFADNVEFTRRAVELASPYGAAVEAELGHISGDEDVARAAAAGAFTDPETATAFEDATGIACLAVSIGNVHGRYAAAPRFDWPRLTEIRERVHCPLSLHGASGLPVTDTARAIQLGVSKINVNTELRERLFTELEAALPETRESLDLLALVDRTTRGIQEVVQQKIELFTKGDAP